MSTAAAEKWSSTSPPTGASFHRQLANHPPLRKMLARFGQLLADFSEVIEPYLTSGDYDYFVKVAVESTAGYERFLRQELYRIPGIRHSSFAHFFLGNYEEGLRCTADVLRHHPTHVQGLRITMACHAMLGNIEAAQKRWQQVALLSPSDRVTETRKRSRWSDQDFAKLQEAYRLAGMPE